MSVELPEESVSELSNPNVENALGSLLRADALTVFVAVAVADSPPHALFAVAVTVLVADAVAEMAPKELAPEANTVGDAEAEADHAPQEPAAVARTAGVTVAETVAVTAPNEDDAVADSCVMTAGYIHFVRRYLYRASRFASVALTPLTMTISAIEPAKKPELME